jgi:DNA mismatch repair enzyme (predicted ATPase)
VRDVGERARSVLDERELVSIDGVREGVEVQALLGGPERARTGATSLHLFVNGRPVRDRQLARAVAFAYGSALAPGRFPVGVVYLSLDPAEVDVNVHPQKAEVRLGRAREVTDALTRVLASGLGTAPFGRTPSRGPSYWSERLPPGPTAARRPVESAHARPAAREPAPAVAPAAAPTTAHDAVRPYSTPRHERTVSTVAAERVEPLPRPSGEAPAHDARAQRARGGLRYLAQLRGTYLLCEGPAGLVIVDHRAADARVRAASLRGALRDTGPAAEARRLLFPERVELDPAEVTRLAEVSQDLERLGFEVSVLGPSTAAVRAVPELLARAAPAELLRDVLDALGAAGRRERGQAMDDAIAAMARRAALRAGEVPSAAEGAALLDSLAAAEGPDGAHGGSGGGGSGGVAWSIPIDEIERRTRG